MKRYIRDIVSNITTMKQLLGMSEAQARAEAIDQVIKQTGYKTKTTKGKPSSPAPSSPRRSSTGLTVQDAKDFIRSMMTDFVGRPSSPSTPKPSSSLDRRSSFRAFCSACAEAAPPPPDEPTPAPKHHTELLYTSGGLSGGLRSGAVNLNHEFRDDATTARWRLDQTRQWK
jgi:hypothetical protein